MTSELEKALEVINRETSKALNNKNHVQLNNTTEKAVKPRQKRDILHQKNVNTYDKQYQHLCKQGYVYSTNQLAKYIYKNLHNAKANPRRRLNEFINRTHNHNILTRLGNGKVPFIDYHGKHYHYVNALQFVYIIARSHQGTLVGVRNALASIAESIITGGISANAVTKFAKAHRGGKHA